MGEKAQGTVWTGMKGQQRSSGHTGVQGIKELGKQVSCTSHHWVQDIGIISRLAAHPFIVWPLSIMRPLRVVAMGPGLESTNYMYKQPTFSVKGHVAYICSLLLTTTAMDTGKIKAQLCTIALGHHCGPQWNPLKPDCSSLPSTMGLNLFMLHILVFFYIIINATNPSLSGHYHAHTIVIMNQPSTLLSSCSFYISKYFPISLTWIETWLVPKYVASPAALSMVSC